MSMTHDQIIAVVQAHKEGKRIEQKMHQGMAGPPWTQWEPVGCEIWNFTRYDYRVKPELREWWLSVGCRGEPVDAWNSKIAAADACSNGMKPVHIREVLDE